MNTINYIRETINFANIWKLLIILYKQIHQCRSLTPTTCLLSSKERNNMCSTSRLLFEQFNLPNTWFSANGLTLNPGTIQHTFRLNPIQFFRSKSFMWRSIHVPRGSPTLDDSSVDKADVLFFLIFETFSYVFQTLKTSLLFLLLNTIFLMVLFFGVDRLIKGR